MMRGGINPPAADDPAPLARMPVCSATRLKSANVPLLMIDGQRLLASISMSFRVNRVTSAVSQPLLVDPDQQIFLVFVGMFQRCQQQTHGAADTPGSSRTTVKIRGVDQAPFVLGTGGSHAAPDMHPSYECLGVRRHTSA